MAAAREADILAPEPGPELQVAAEDGLRRSSATARLVASWIGPGQGTLLWITEAGIWPSLENAHLLRCLRAVHGEARPLLAAPGHAFGAVEPDELVTFVQLAILSGWGGALLGRENGHRVLLSHDSLLSVRSTAEMPALVADVEAFGLQHRFADQPRDTVAALGLEAGVMPG